MKSYEFYDIFKKTCTFENDIGKCTKTRESKKCIDNTCTKVVVPETKSQVLEDYYRQVGGSHKTFSCPGKGCNYKSSDFGRFQIHTQKKHQMSGTQSKCEGCGCKIKLLSL